MNEKLRRFPFRWLLPAIQLLLCVFALWPSRYFLLFEFSQSLESYPPAQLGKKISFPIDIAIPPLTPEQQVAVNRDMRIMDLGRSVAIALNLPVGIAQLPYVIASRAKTEWVPRGMMTDAWRAMSWPLAGVLFWWSAGRGVEALRSSRKAVISPRVTLVETVFGSVLVVIGIVALVGAITSTPDDRRDVQFIALLGGGLLWGILASITISARVCQWRIRKRAIPVASLT